MTKSYFSDAFITQDEANSLYQRLNTINGIRKTTDFTLFTTHEMGEISRKLSKMQHEFSWPINTNPVKFTIEDINGRKHEITSYGKDVPTQLGLKLDNILGDYEQHVQSVGFRDLIKPLSIEERLKRSIYAFLKD